LHRDLEGRRTHSTHIDLDLIDDQVNSKKVEANKILLGYQTRKKARGKRTKPDTDSETTVTPRKFKNDSGLDLQVIHSKKLRSKR
jgi:hypothetical protein